MRVLKKLIAVLMALTMLTCIPINAQAFTSGNIFGLGTITHQDKYKNYDLYQGVDISYHNGTVNWAKLKSAGVKFVILRAGNRFAQSGKIGKDSQFDNYIKGAYAQGLKIGIYFYSQAITVAEAKEEANKTLEYIAPYKNYITLPVAFDYEFSDGISNGRLIKQYNAWAKSERKSKMTAIADGFCRTIEAAGYDAMIYASKSFFEDNLNYQQLQKDYTIWVAHYINQSKGRNSTDYKGDYNFWQFSSTGKISGVSGYVDTNFMYALPEAEAIPDQEYTGSKVEPEVTVTNGISPLTKGSDYAVTYSNNINYGVATATVKGLGKYASLISTTVNFNIVPKTVQNLKIDSKTTDSISVSWDKTDDADGYQLAYINYVGVPINIRNLGKDVNSAVLNNAKSASSYTYCVRGYKKVGDKTYYGAYSETAQAVTKPVAVTGVTTYKRTHNAITLRWNAVGSSEKYFIFRYNETSKRYEYIGCAPNKTEFTVKKLPIDTKYKFIVKASKLDENGAEMVSPASAEHISYTIVPATTLKTITAKAGRKIKIKWKNIAGIQGYEIMWSTSKDFSSNKKSIEVKAGTTTTTLQAYYAKKKYYVRVRTYTIKNGEKHYSPWSNKLSVKSKK